MQHIKNLQEAQEICAQFSGYSVARSAKTINKIYRPYQLLDRDLQPLFAFDSVLASYLYLGGYLVKNGGILQAANPDADHITFKMGAPEDAAGFDKNGNPVL